MYSCRWSAPGEKTKRNKENESYRLARVCRSQMVLCGDQVPLLAFSGSLRNGQTTMISPLSQATSEWLLFFLTQLELKEKLEVKGKD